MSEMREYEPRGNRVYAYQVTRQNAEAAAREFGCAVKEEPKASDPTDIAMWFIAPMIDSTPHLLITSEGPVVGREKETNRLVAWKTKREFNELYQPARIEAAARMHQRGESSTVARFGTDETRTENER